MSLEVKICGINSIEAAQAAKIADFVGFVFYPRSPRYINGKKAQELSTYLPKSIKKVGIFVEEEDDKISEILSLVKLDYLQFHGEESPDRIDQVRKKFKLPVIKAIKVEKEKDLEAAYPYYQCANMLLFDTKPPKSLKNLVENSHKQNKGIISLCHMSAPEARISYELDIIQKNKKISLYKLFLNIDNFLKFVNINIFIGVYLTYHRYNYLYSN